MISPNCMDETVSTIYGTQQWDWAVLIIKPPLNWMNSESSLQLVTFVFNQQTVDQIVFSTWSSLRCPCLTGLHLLPTSPKKSWPYGPQQFCGHGEPGRFGRRHLAKVESTSGFCSHLVPKSESERDKQSFWHSKSWPKHTQTESDDHVISFICQSPRRWRATSCFDDIGWPQGRSEEQRSARFRKVRQMSRLLKKRSGKLEAKNEKTKVPNLRQNIRFHFWFPQCFMTQTSSGDLAEDHGGSRNSDRKYPTGWCSPELHLLVLRPGFDLQLEISPEGRQSGPRRGYGGCEFQEWTVPPTAVLETCSMLSD